MRASLTLTVEYADEAEAAMVHAALEPDNEGHVISSREGRELRFRIEADSAGTLRNSADDLLACLRAAEETISVGLAGPVADLDGDPLLE